MFGRHVSYQRVELVWGILILITFSGQAYSDAIWNVPYSLGPDGFIEPGVNAHIWCPHFLHGKLPNFFECPRSTLLEAHSMDALVNVDGVFSGHHLVDGRTALLLLATLLCVYWFLSHLGASEPIPSRNMAFKEINTSFTPHPVAG